MIFNLLRTSTKDFYNKGEIQIKTIQQLIELIQKEDSPIRIRKTLKEDTPYFYELEIQDEME